MSIHTDIQFPADMKNYWNICCQGSLFLFCCLADSFDRIPHLERLVNTFFRLFSIFFIFRIRTRRLVFMMPHFRISAGYSAGMRLPSSYVFSATAIPVLKKGKEALRRAGQRTIFPARYDVSSKCFDIRNKQRARHPSGPGRKNFLRE